MAGGEHPYGYEVDEAVLDPKTQMVTMSNGTRLTREQYELHVLGQLPGQGPPPLLRTIQAGGRRAGVTHRSFLRDIEEFRVSHRGRSSIDKAHLAYILKQTTHRVVIWQSKGRYTYVAVNAGDWYISGKGEWYGKNQFTPEEFIDLVVTHDEVTSIHVVTDVETLWSR